LKDRLVRKVSPHLAQWKRKRFLAFLPLAFLLAVLAGCGGSGGGGESTAASGFTGGTGTAVLSWSPPSTNTDGSPVSLKGFNIYVGTSPSNLQPVLMVSAVEMITVLNGLPSGTYYFAVTAISNTGAESALSNIESKTIS
jgi:hypothetical protein